MVEWVSRATRCSIDARGWLATQHIVEGRVVIAHSGQDEVYQHDDQWPTYSSLTADDKEHKFKPPSIYVNINLHFKVRSVITAIDQSASSSAIWCCIVRYFIDDGVQLILLDQHPCSTQRAPTHSSLPRNLPLATRPFGLLRVVIRIIVYMSLTRSFVYFTNIEPSISILVLADRNYDEY